MRQISPWYSEQTAKISKTGFSKIGHTAISKPQWVGFSSTKTDYDKFESWKKIFSISLFGLFSTEPPKYFSATRKNSFYRGVSTSVNYVSTTRKVVSQVNFDGFTSR